MKQKQENTELKLLEKAYKKQVGRQIAILRKLRGLTQEKLAEKANIALSSLGYIEAGEAMPEAITQIKIAQALNVDIAELLNFPKEDIKDLVNSVKNKIDSIQESKVKIQAVNEFLKELL